MSQPAQRTASASQRRAKNESRQVRPEARVGARGLQAAPARRGRHTAPQEPRESEAKEREDEQQGSRGQNPRLPIGIHQRPRYRSLGNPEGRVCPSPLPQPSGPTVPCGLRRGVQHGRRVKGLHRAAALVRRQPNCPASPAPACPSSMKGDTDSYIGD